ncbi:MAG: LptF/LptG family permease [Planctomycetia bacterium]|nr:LptF/LptG family permease [Planctomycetia bacterium]
MDCFKIIPGRLLRQLFLIFFAFQVGITLFFVILALFLQGVVQKLPLSEIPKLLPYLFPYSMSLSGQFVVMLTCVLVYSQLTASREILALQSSGISSWRVMYPAFLLAFAMSFVNYWMIDLHNSWGKFGIGKVLAASAENILYSTLKNDGMIQYRDYSFSVKSVEGRTLHNLTFTHRNPEVAFACSAQTAMIQVGQAKYLKRESEKQFESNFPGFTYSPRPEETVIKITLDNVTHSSKERRGIIPGRTIVFISPEKLEVNRFIRGISDERPSTMSIDRLDGFVEEQNERIHEVENQILVQASRNLVFGKIDAFESSVWQDLHQEIRRCQRSIERAKIEPTRRWATSFNCFFIALLSVPLALKKGKSSPLSVFSAIIAPLVLSYYPLQMIFLNAAKDGALPALCMWIPNLGLLVFGIVFIRRAL